MIQTEKATAYYDLPHKFELADFKSLTCTCTRVKEDALHRHAAREVAGDRAVLMTEKGS